MKKVLLGVLMGAGWLAAPGLAEPNTPAFTYQGELQSGGSRVTTPVDLRFRLFDAAAGGLQVGGTLGSAGVTPVDGRFSVSLDFGGAAFAGERRWLQVEVAQAGSGVYTPLTPRQELASSPFATYAMNIPAQYATFTQSSGSAVFTGGNVGVGTTTPTAGLHVTRVAPGGLAMNVDDRLYVSDSQAFVGVNRTGRVSTAETFGLQNTASQTGYTGMYIKSTSPTGLPFYGYQAPGATGWTQMDNAGQWSLFLGGSARLVATVAGDVGVGTTTPGARLDVAGTARATAFQFADGSVQTRAALDPGDTGTTSGLAATARYRVLANGVELPGATLASNPSVLVPTDAITGAPTGTKALENLLRLKRSAAGGLAWYTLFTLNQNLGTLTVEQTQSGVPGSSPRVVWNFGAVRSTSWRLTASDDGGPAEELTMWFDATAVTRTLTGAFTPGLPGSGVRGGYSVPGGTLRVRMAGTLLSGTVLTPALERVAPTDPATGLRTGAVRIPQTDVRGNASETFDLYGRWISASTFTFDAVAWTPSSETPLFTWTQARVSRWSLVRADDGTLVEDFHVVGLQGGG